MARTARTVRRSAAPGPAPTSRTRPGFDSGGMALLALVGDQAGDLGTAGTAGRPRRRQRGDGVDTGAAGGFDAVAANPAAGADDRADVERLARRPAHQQQGAGFRGQPRLAQQAGPALA